MSGPISTLVCGRGFTNTVHISVRHSGVRVLTVSIVLFAAFNALVARAAQTRMVTRRGAVYTFADDAALEFLDRQTQPGEDVFVYPYYPMYYFLSGTTNPTRFSILLYHNNTDAQFFHNL